MTTMSLPFHQPAASAAVPSFDLRTRLSRLYDLAQNSGSLFGSPLGSLPGEGSAQALPRFVYFGPLSSEASPRLAIFSGLGRHDLSAARAVTAFVENLALAPHLGHALNLSFFPVVNVFGLLGDTEDRDLSDEHWAHSSASEITLLAQDAWARSYQGYVRVVTTTDDEPAATLRTVLPSINARSGIEVFDSSDFDSWPVRFESLAAGAFTYGPLSLAEDLPFAPFEVELEIPSEWPQARADAELATLLTRLITRYRGFLAYGQHL